MRQCEGLCPVAVVRSPAHHADIDASSTTASSRFSVVSPTARRTEGITEQ